MTAPTFHDLATSPAAVDQAADLWRAMDRAATAQAALADAKTRWARADVAADALLDAVAQLDAGIAAIATPHRAAAAAAAELGVALGRLGHPQAPKLALTPGETIAVLADALLDPPKNSPFKPATRAVIAAIRRERDEALAALNDAAKTAAAAVDAAVAAIKERLA